MEQSLQEMLSTQHASYPSGYLDERQLQSFLEEGKEMLGDPPRFFLSPTHPIRLREEEGYKTLFKIVGEIIKWGAKENGLAFPDYHGTYWAGGGDFVSRHFGHGQWKHLGIDRVSKDEHGIKFVQHDITSKRLPFPAGSEDVAIFKTVGTINTDMNRNGAYFLFWEKIRRCLKENGILASSYNLPPEFSSRFRQVTNLGNSGRDYLSFKWVTVRFEGYSPDAMYFFQKVKT